MHWTEALTCPLELVVAELGLAANIECQINSKRKDNSLCHYLQGSKKVLLLKGVVRL